MGATALNESLAANYLLFQWLVDSVGEPDSRLSFSIDSRYVEEIKCQTLPR